MVCADVYICIYVFENYVQLVYRIEMRFRKISLFLLKKFNSTFKSGLDVELVI